MINYSIVISTYNQVETLRLALESLRRQIKNPKTFEIIVADDYSNDNTEELIKKLHYPIFLKYTRAVSNQGRAKNRNRGYQKAVGQWIIFLDGDMLPEPDFIESYLRAWDEYPDAVAIGSWKLPREWWETRWQRYLATRGRMTKNHGDIIPGKYFTGGNFAVKKTIIDHLCGFETSFEGWGGEDTDFGFKLDNENIPIRYIPKACCYHYHKKTLSETVAEYEKFGQGGFPLLTKRYPNKIIFERGWLLGLPFPGNSLGRKIIAILLFPLRSRLTLAFLKFVARIKDGALCSDFMFDLLFYGNLAKGYRRRGK
jgi:glycosyltransferase involved in cell wall biosynthesis